MAVTTGHLANFTIAGSDPWEEIDDHVHIYDLVVEQEAIERTKFDGGAVLGKLYHRGKVTVSGRLEGHFGSLRIFAGGVITATNLQDLAPGKAQSTLTLQSETGQAVIVEANLFNIEFGVDENNQLNTITADFFGDITGVA